MDFTILAVVLLIGIGVPIRNKLIRKVDIGSYVRNCALNQIFQTTLRVSTGSAINLNTCKLKPRDFLWL